jgi:hypothetical protein
VRAFWIGLGICFVAGVIGGVIECKRAHADLRIDVLASLNMILDDADDRKLSSTEKYRALDLAGDEMGKSFVYRKLDTVTTVSDQRTYALNTDCAGGLYSVFWQGSEPGEVKWIPIIDASDRPLQNKENPTGVVAVCWLADETNISFDEIPLTSGQTFVVSYYAYPNVLRSVADSVEWTLPDGFEPAAIQMAADIALAKIGMDWAEQKGQKHRESGLTSMDRLKNVQPTARQVGDTLK